MKEALPRWSRQLCADVPTVVAHSLPCAQVNTKLLADYAALDARLRPLIFLVKHWAKRRGVNDSYRWAHPARLLH